MTVVEQGATLYTLTSCRRPPLTGSKLRSEAYSLGVGWDALAGTYNARLPVDERDPTSRASARSGRMVGEAKPATLSVALQAAWRERGRSGYQGPKGRRPWERKRGVAGGLV